MPRPDAVKKKTPRKAAETPGRPRLVNQVLLDRMVELRHQGFSHREIAQKVNRSVRTVGRYLRGVSPQLQLPTTPKRADVLTRCGKIILYARDRLELTTQEVDYLFKKLRKTFEQRDPLTRDWLATDSRARVDFLFNEVLRPAMSEIKLRRWIEHFRELVGDGGMTDEEVRDQSGSSANRLLPP